MPQKNVFDFIKRNNSSLETGKGCRHLLSGQRKWIVLHHVVAPSGYVAQWTIWHFMKFKLLLSITHFHTITCGTCQSNIFRPRRKCQTKIKKKRKCESAIHFQAALWNYFCILTYLLKSVLSSRENSLTWTCSIISKSWNIQQLPDNYRKDVFARNYFCLLSKTMTLHDNGLGTSPKYLWKSELRGHCTPVQEL